MLCPVIEMIEKLADRVSEYMVSKGVCEVQDREILAYGFWSIFSDLLQILILVIIALLSRAIPHMAAYALSYGALRRNTGGVHASTHLGCILTYTAASLIAVIIGRLLPLMYSRPLAVIIMAFAVAAVFLFAPVSHPNFPRKPEALKRFKRRGRAVVLAECAAVILSVILAPDRLMPVVFCAGLGGGLAAFTLLPFFHKNEGKGDAE